MCEPVIKLLSEIIYIIFITVVGAAGGIILSDMYATPVIESVVGGVLVLWVINYINNR